MSKEIKEVDFSKLPDVKKYENDKVKNNATKTLIIIFCSLIISTGVGIGLFFLINYFAS